MSLLRTLAIGAIGFGVYATLQDRYRKANVVVAKPEPLQRWEGEGGNVPAANPALKEAEGATAPLRQDRTPDA
jgi:hypothetical protein